MTAEHINVPLSENCVELISLIFSLLDQQQAKRLLLEECGSNLPFLEKSDSQELDRFRFAALKCSCGSLERLKQAVDLAKVDWRDLLVAADFANDVNSHRNWWPDWL